MDYNFNVGDKIKYFGGMDSMHLVEDEIYTIKKYRNETKSHFNTLIRVGYVTLEEYPEHEYMIKYFGLAIPKIFKKQNLKDNHICVDRLGNKKIAEKIIKSTEWDDNLVYKYHKSLDIVEVWEFNTMIWRRTEPILSDEEKIYLGIVIKPFRKKVIYISRDEKDIIIAYKKDDVNILVSLPLCGRFENMENDKNYEPEDLGL